MSDDFWDAIKALSSWFFLALVGAFIVFVILALLAGMPFTLTMYRVCFWVTFFGGILLFIAACLFDDWSKSYCWYHHGLEEGVAEPEAFEEVMKRRGFGPPRFVCEWFRQKG